jgi:outer membrane protein TolC
MRHAAVILLAILLAALPIHGQDENRDEKGPEKISLDRFIRLACQNDPKFQVILADNLKIAYKRRLKLPPRDIVLSATAGFGVLVNDPDQFGPDVSVSLNKLFPKSGTRVSGFFELKPYKNNYELYTAYGVEISQSIARNAFGKTSRMLDHVTGLESRLARYQIIEAYEEYLSKLIELYHQWKYDYHNYRTARQAQQDYLRLLGNVRQRRRMRVADNTDVNQVYLQYLNLKETTARARMQYEKSHNEVARSCGLAEYTEKGDNARPGDSISRFPGKEEREIQEFLNESRTSQMFQVIEKKENLKVEMASDDLLPSTHFVIGFRRDESAWDPGEGTSTLYGGFRLDHNFINEHARAKLGEARANRKKEKLTIRENRSRLLMNLKNLHRAITMERNLVDLHSERARVAQAIVNGKQRRYRQARTNLSDLVQSMKELHKQRNAVVNHRYRLSRLVTEWLRLTDSLVVREDIEKRHGQ